MNLASLCSCLLLVVAECLLPSFLVFISFKAITSINMKAALLSIPVLDQQKALVFYTEILGFKVKKNEPMGGDHRWITLVSREWEEGPELLLEPAPLHFEPSRVYQQALKEAGIPYTLFHVKSVDAEYERLSALGVAFPSAPTVMGKMKFALLDDTCGNYIQLLEAD